MRCKITLDYFNNINNGPIRTVSGHCMETGVWVTSAGLGLKGGAV